jgi:hypothetical protein
MYVRIKRTPPYLKVVEKKADISAGYIELFIITDRNYFQVVSSPFLSKNEEFNKIC